MIIIENREYRTVSALSTQTFDYTIPNGSILTLEEMGASSVSGTNTFVQIIWDPAGENRVLITEYSSFVQKTSTQLIGDGSKVIRLSLTNNNIATSEIIGGYYRGQLT